MNVNDIKRLYERRGVKICNPRCEHPVLESGDVKHSDQEQVLIHVFARDPLTNKPMNDLVLVANQRLNPTVREFIKQNLQAPVTPDRAADYQLNEDLCRKDHETVFEYQQRLRQMTVDGVEYIKQASQKIAKSKKVSKQSKTEE